MARTTISISEDVKDDLEAAKPDGMTWDEFFRSWLADEALDTGTVDLSDGSMKDIETMLDRQFESLRSEFR